MYLYLKLLPVALILLSFMPGKALGQTPSVDDLQKKLASAQSDTQKVKVFNALAEETKNPDTALFFAGEALRWCDPQKQYEAYKKAARLKLTSLLRLNKNEEGLQFSLDVLKTIEPLKDTSLSGRMHTNVGLFYRRMKQYDRAIRLVRA